MREFLAEHDMPGHPEVRSGVVAQIQKEFGAVGIVLMEKKETG